MNQSSEIQDSKKKWSLAWIYGGIVLISLWMMYVVSSPTSKNTSAASVPSAPEIVDSSSQSAAANETVMPQQEVAMSDVQKIEPAAPTEPTPNQETVMEASPAVEKKAVESFPAQQSPVNEVSSAPNVASETAAPAVLAQEKESSETKAFAASTLPEVSEPTPAKTSISPSQICKLTEWDIQYPCDLSREVLDKDDKNARRVALSKDPLVTLSWQQFNKQVHFVNQLNRSFFEKFNVYDNGFQMENVKFAGHDAVLVKGTSKEEPKMQMRDYYYVVNHQLVGVLFRVSPSERWEDGKWIVKRVKDSFEPLPKE